MHQFPASFSLLLHGLYLFDSIQYQFSSFFRQGSDEESNQQSQRRFNNKRRVCSERIESFFNRKSNV